MHFFHPMVAGFCQSNFDDIAGSDGFIGVFLARLLAHFEGLHITTIKSLMVGAKALGF